MRVKDVFSLILSTALVSTMSLGIAEISQADDARARQIMDKADARDDGDNMTCDMEMVLIDRKGKERVRKIHSFSKDKGKDTMRLMFFLHPADVEGTGFLTHDYDDTTVDDDQWLYLPALRKTKRIASSDKSGSFMGSDFTYSDMTSFNLEDYDFSLLKEMDVQGAQVWVIEALPRTKEVVDKTGNEKSILLVRQDNYYVIRSVHWVKNSGDVKYMDVKKLESIDGIWVGTEVHMTTMRNNELRHKTVLTLNDLHFGQDLAENLFSVHRLEKGR